MINELAMQVESLLRDHKNPSKIGAILRKRGVEISTAEVKFILRWRLFKSRLDAKRAQEDERRARMREIRRKQKQISKQRLEDAKRRNADLMRYERFGCTIDPRGKVRLPKMEAAE